MELLYNAGAALAYGVVGTVLMVLGYLIIDLLTPGKLAALIWEQRNRNAALVVAANTLGVAVVVVTAILASEVGLMAGLTSTLVYGLVGLVLMAGSFLAIDLLTPGELGSLTGAVELHPASWVTATAHFSVALVVAAAIS